MTTRESGACSWRACIRRSPTCLPDRLEFYENWLTVPGLREGTIGLAPLSAVLSFLRLEGEAYNRDHGACRRIRGGLDGQQHVDARAARDLRACRRCCGRAAHSGRPGRSSARRIPGRASRSGCGAARRRSICAARSSAKPAKRPRCRSAGSTRPRSRACCSIFRCAPTPQVNECRASSRGKGCRLKVEVRGANAGEPAAAA